MSNNRFSLFRGEDPTRPSTKGSEVYVHSGLAESDSDGIGDPDEVRADVHIMEQLDTIDPSTPEGAAEKERLENEFVANMIGHAAVLESNTDTVSELHNPEDRTDTGNV